jgi:hypothetical protein
MGLALNLPAVFLANEHVVRCLSQFFNTRRTDGTLRARPND